MNFQEYKQVRLKEPEFRRAYEQEQRDRRARHVKDRLSLLRQAGCTEDEILTLCTLLTRHVRRWVGEDFAVGLYCAGVVDPTERNGPTQNVVGAVVRWEGKKAFVKTFFISRRSQFRRSDSGRSHFQVAHTYLEEGEV